MKPIEVKRATVSHLFAKHNQRYFIPTYQRPYSWTEENCEILWDDLINFFFPNNNESAFNRDKDEYPLGIFIVFPNERGQDEVVDGQQRLITLLLLMKALYDTIANSKTSQYLGECIYHSNEMHELDMSLPKVELGHADNKNISIFKEILSIGSTLKKNKDNFSANFRLFQRKIAELPEEWRPLFATRLLNNVYVLHNITTDEDDAMTLFLNLNDKGMSLPVDQIFKAQLVKSAFSKGGKPAAENTEKLWLELETKSKEVFLFYKNLDPILTLFWLYGLQHHAPIQNLVQVKQVFGKDNYSLLTADATLIEIIDVVNFLHTLKTCDPIYPKSLLKKAVFLWQARNISWFSALIKFFLKNRDASNNVSVQALELLLDRCIAYTVGLVISGDSMNQLNKIRGLTKSVQRAVELGQLSEEHKFSRSIIIDNMKTSHELTSLSARRRLLLSWWLLLTSDNYNVFEKLQIEHIFSKKLAQCRPLINPLCIEMLGNLALLEQGINQKCTNLSFADKRHYYLGNSPTINEELQQLARDKENFGEEEIYQRNDKITAAILNLLKRHDFLTD